MNYKVLRRIEGLILKVESACLLVPCIASLIYGEVQGLAYLGTAVFSYIIGALLMRNSEGDQKYFIKEGFAVVGLSWVTMSVFGALPLAICGDIPSYVNALFETVSGFTTTGASILKDVEALSHTSLLWRSFTHWVGGMGVFVLILAVFPMSGGHNMNLMKAESPGPSVGKLVPRLRDTAIILYGIYLALTVMEFIFLLIAGCPM